MGIGAELLLAKYLGRAPEYKVDGFGKPYGEQVEFNFSHSGSIALCVVSEKTVGADVEKIRDVNLEKKKKKFCKREFEDIINSKNPKVAFFEYWVKKESYVKALGTGFKTALNEFDVGKISDFDFHTHSFGEYKMCVCAKEFAKYYIVGTEDFSCL